MEMTRRLKSEIQEKRDTARSKHFVEVMTDPAWLICFFLGIFIYGFIFSHVQLRSFLVTGVATCIFAKKKMVSDIVNRRCSTEKLLSYGCCRVHICEKLVSDIVNRGLLF